MVNWGLRERHDHGYRQVMQNGRSKYASELLAVPALRKDGARISVEFTLILIRYEPDHILGAAAIIRDVTARWQKERALKRRLDDLEAQFDQQSVLFAWASSKLYLPEGTLYPF